MSRTPNIRLPSSHDRQHDFANIPKLSMPRSTFDRSSRRKFTFNQGDLIPCFVDEGLPGDTFSLRVTALIRLNTPQKPIMDELSIFIAFFAVPNRLLWTNWVRFMGEQDTPAASTSFIMPVVTTPGGGYAVQSLADYFGLPPSKQFANVQALPFRAYNQIYNYWFRDENLCLGVANNLNDGPDAAGDYSVKKIAKRRDYFTSALPWPQKPLAGTPPVTSQSMGVSVRPADYPGHAVPTFWNVTGATNAGALQRAAAGAGTGVNIQNAGPINDQLGWNNPNLQVLINDLRFAYQIQHFLERDARGGTRYPEKIKAHFDVDNPDARMQRPEYLGGGTVPIIVTPIAQNGATPFTNPVVGGAATPQGNLSAIGTGLVQGIGFVKSFTEHVTIIGLCAVRSEITYQQGCERFWHRSTIYDFYWPEFQFLGEQTILNREIYADGTANDQLIFGYQERYGEYRYKQSIVAGLFRSGVAGSIDMWHLAQNFGALPTLGQTFIEDTAPMSRVVAVAGSDFQGDWFFNVKSARPMAMFGVPQLSDHF